MAPPLNVNFTNAKSYADQCHRVNGCGRVKLSIPNNKCMFVGDFTNYGTGTVENHAKQTSVKAIIK